MNIQQLVQDVLDGQESGLIALAVLKEEKKIIEDCIKQVEPTAMEEAEKYTEKSFQFKDLMIEKRNGGKQFNYKNIPEWNTAKAELTSVEEKAKAAYLNHEKGNLTADQNGEVVILPEVTHRKDSLIIKRVQL